MEGKNGLGDNEDGLTPINGKELRKEALGSYRWRARICEDEYDSI